MEKREIWPIILIISSNKLDSNPRIMEGKCPSSIISRAKDIDQTDLQESRSQKIKLIKIAITS